MSETIRSLFAWVGVVATLSGALAGVSWLWDSFSSSRHAHTVSLPWVESREDIDINSASEFLPNSIFANVIRVAEGQYALPSPSVWIANRIVIDPAASLTVRDGTFIAKEIVGGSIRADGAAGASSGAPGAAGGRLRIVVLDRLASALSASGGVGAPGARGKPGRDGRSGKCAGFGGWSPGQNGQRGGDGLPGGAAGKGGVVELIAPSGVLDLIPDIPIHAGNPGHGGEGGPGGRGGRGCTGLGGSQASRSPGPPGLRGPDGAVAESGADRRIAADAVELSTRFHAARQPGEFLAIIDSLTVN